MFSIIQYIGVEPLWETISDDHLHIIHFKPGITHYISDKPVQVQKIVVCVFYLIYLDYLLCFCLIHDKV